MAYEIVGNLVVEWDDDEPFTFTLRQAKGPEHTPSGMVRLSIDLSSLREGFEDDFLLSLKNHHIERLFKVSCGQSEAIPLNCARSSKRSLT